MERCVLRVAVGQLLDYRRGVERPDAADLAVLLPQKPDDDALGFLRSVGVEAFWFEELSLERIEGRECCVVPGLSEAGAGLQLSEQRSRSGYCCAVAGHTVPAFRTSMSSAARYSSVRFRGAQ